MKDEFVKAYNKACVIAEDRYREVYKWHNFTMNIHNIDEFGMTFQFEEWSMGHHVNSEYVTVVWGELS